MDKTEYKQRLLLTDRRSLSIDSVTNIDALGDDYVELSSDAGKITVEGNELKIEELNHEKRTVSIIGHIDAITYKNEKRASSFFSRFRK